ncbi:MAG: hypothetical protein H0W08_14050 [Acidobacteria bacterium]|nr:hypothetical protein [Acidobacteriota bacterium]
MAKRRDPKQKEYNPLDDARGRFPIEVDLVRDVIGEPANATPALAAADATATALVPPEAYKESRGVEKLVKYNKFLTTPREKLELERLAARLSGALGVSVKPSQVIRACLIHLLHAEHEIIRHAERQPTVRRPSNTEAIALAEFDQVIAEILSAAFRDAGPIRPKR